MTARIHRHLALAGLLGALAACTSTHAARAFPPASAEDARRSLAAWSSARERAASLPASRLLYDAKLGAGAAPSVPGTLAVTYDGRAVVTASLTGPFGSRVAEYREGTVSGQDRQALVVDPEALRSVLAGTWNDGTPSVRGFEGGQCELDLADGDARVVAVIDVASERVLSMDVSGRAGRLFVDYSGETNPWPSRLTVRDAGTKKSLALKLVTIEPMGAAGSAAP